MAETSTSCLSLDPATRVPHGCQTLFLLIFTILWNGFVWPMVGFVMTKGWDQSGSWFFYLFMLPFMGMGLWTIWLTFSSLITRRYPVPRVEVDGAVLAEGGIWAGSTFAVRWRFAERAGLFQRLTVSVIGCEEARVTRGTDTVTERSVFHRKVLFEGATGFAQGEVTVSIPGDAAPSFQSPNNRIAWLLRMEGTPRVRYWPVLEREFVMVVGARPNL